MVTRVVVAPDHAAAVAVAPVAALDLALDHAPDRDHDLARADHARTRAVDPAAAVTRVHDHAQDHDKQTENSYRTRIGPTFKRQHPSLFLQNPFTPCIAGRN